MQASGRSLHYVRDNPELSARITRHETIQREQQRLRRALIVFLTLMACDLPIKQCRCCGHSDL